MTQAAPADELADRLRQRGMRVTPQRLAVYRELEARGTHSSAQEVWEAVQVRLPGISVPTVYAALDLAVDLGLARKVDLGTGTGYYDPHTGPHHHTVCRRCGRIDDVDAEVDTRALIDSSRADGFQPDGAEAVVTGLCADCAAATA